MKRVFLLFITSVTIFLLSSCFIGSIDSWKLDKDLKEELLSNFYDYVNDEEFNGYTYQSISYSCVNCKIEYDGVESWGSIIEDESRTYVYMNHGEYMMIHKNKYMEQYYHDGSLFIQLGETKSKIETNEEDLKLQERHLYVYGILTNILAPGNIDNYVKKVSANEDFAGHIYMTFELDMRKLKEDRIIDDDTTIDFSIEFLAKEGDWDTKEFYNMEFRVKHGYTNEKLTLFAPDLEYVLSELFPEDLEMYE